MSDVSTEGLGFQAADWLSPEELTGRVRHLLAQATGSVVTALGMGWCGESSAQIHPVWVAEVRRLQEEERVADFFEPVTFNWDEDIYIARMAARRYCEQIHADY